MLQLATTPSRHAAFLPTAAAQRLYRQIADRLRESIELGDFSVGQRLPAERDLAQQLGVSRPSVREALIALEVEGWVEVRTGSGVYVIERQEHADLPDAVSASEWGPLELIRARRVVEGETAALAATQARRKDHDAMARAIDTMRALAGRGLAPLEGDRAFHVAIVRASGNAVLVDTIERFWEARNGALFMRLGGYFETPQSWRAAIAEHETVRDAIVLRNQAEARAAMHAHMDKSHRRFSASWRRARVS